MNKLASKISDIKKNLFKVKENIQTLEVNPSILEVQYSQLIIIRKLFEKLLPELEELTDFSKYNIVQEPECESGNNKVFISPNAIIGSLKKCVQSINEFICLTEKSVKFESQNVKIADFNSYKKNLILTIYLIEETIEIINKET